MRSTECAVAGVDAVVHTAASFESDFAAARRVNVEGSALLAEAALREGCRRFVHLSTCGAYDLVGLDVVDESTPLWRYDETSPLVYGVTKAEADRSVARAVEAGLPAVVLRFPNVLGADVDNFYAYGLPLAIRDGKVNVGGDGSNTWPVVHVGDLVEAILLALDHPRAAGGTYTVVDHHTTWGEFAGRMAAWFDVELAQRERRAPYDMFEGRFSSEKVRTELGYAPRLTYEDAMLETRRFLEEQGVLD
jgi:nucleoside-diphosphate-sugar epimerase